MFFRDEGTPGDNQLSFKYDESNFNSNLNDGHLNHYPGEKIGSIYLTLFEIGNAGLLMGLMYNITVYFICV